MAFFLLVHCSCSNCARIRCEGANNQVTIRLMHNGENAVFGPDAFIDRASLRLFVPHLNYPDTEYPITYIDSTQSIQLSIAVGQEQILAFPGSINTLLNTYYTTQKDECCQKSILVSLMWNDIEICIEGCNELIDIDI